MKQKVWRQYEHIIDIDWIYMGGIMDNFVKGLDKYGIRNYLKESLTIAINFDMDFYFHPDEFISTQKGIVSRVAKNPQWGLSFNNELEKLINEYFEKAKSFIKINLDKKSNKELANLWERLRILKEESHAMGVITTWIIDAHDQPFTKYLLEILNQRIVDQKINYDVAEVLTILTTPKKLSSLRIEEIELIKLYQNFFEKNESSDFQKEIEKFAQKFGWLYFKYIGPGRTAKDYIKILQNWKKINFNPKSQLKKIALEQRRIQSQQKLFIKALKLNKKEKKLFQFARQIIILKDLRKASQFYGSYVNEKILTEIGKRLSLNLKQVRNFLPQEISPVLIRDNFDAKNLDERRKFSVLFSQRNKIAFLAEKQAKSFLKKQTIEDTEIKKDNEIKGICACVGNAKGIVKIINTKSEINKIKMGEIMISHATYPELVPAMKKASAIITEEGGLSCHAAIVSRELGIPCVVGTKIATKVLKDGDLVEVDANKGIVKLLK